jgi:hypothetical protein
VPIGLYWADETTSLVRMVESRKTVQEAVDESVSKLVDQVCDQYGYPNPSTHESDMGVSVNICNSSLGEFKVADHRILSETRTDTM